MDITYFRNGDDLVAGITLKNEGPNDGNLALHTGGNKTEVLQNRKQLANELRFPLSQFVFANQTHSNHFYKVEKDDIGNGTLDLESAIPDTDDTDALYTFEPNVVLCSMTADCVPVLIYEPESGLTAAIHSGWQGTVKEITPKLLRHLKENEQIDLAKCEVFIGPALSQKRFEVDEDVAKKFRDLGYANELMYVNEETNKTHIDNQLTVQKQCINEGILEKHVFIDRSCTFDMEQGFSYRQNKSCGRHVSFIARRS